MSTYHHTLEDGQEVSAAMPGVRQKPRREGKVTFFFLILFTLLLYARPQDMLRSLTPIPMAEIVGICAVLAYLAARLQGSLPFRWPTELKIMLVLTVWFILGVPFSIWRTNSLDVLTQQWFKTLLIFFLLTQTLTTMARVRKLLWVIVISIFVVSTVSLIAGPRGQDSATRLMGVSEGILWGNTAGIALGCYLPFMIALVLQGRSILKSLFVIGTFIAGMLLVLAAASRAGVLCTIAALALIWLVMFSQGWQARFYGTLLAFGIILTLTFTPGIWRMRFQVLWDSGSMQADPLAEAAAMSGERRQELLLRSIKFTLQKPVFGAGLGNFIVASGQSVGESYAWQVTHNSFTEVSSEAGIPAFLLFTALFVIPLRRLRRISHAAMKDPATPELALFCKASLASLLAFGFGLMFVGLSYSIAVYYPIALAIALQAQAPQAGTEKLA